MASAHPSCGRQRELCPPGRYHFEVLKSGPGSDGSYADEGLTRLSKLSFHREESKCVTSLAQPYESVGCHVSERLVTAGPRNTPSCCVMDGDRAVLPA